VQRHDMNTIVIGIDGGGSKTHAIVADEAGTQLGEASGAASAVRPGHAQRSAEIIVGVARDALVAAGVADAFPRALCVGVAGVGRDSVRQEFWRALAEHNLAEEIIVRPDYALALDDAFGDGAGIVLIAGTGSVAFGRGPTDVVERCGGWGPVFGDEGSAAWIGRRALSVVTASADGREPETALTGAILTATQANEPADLVAWAADATPASFAALAPVVMAVAEGEDRRANTLLDLAVEELALHIRTLGRVLFVDERVEFPVALTGGMLAPGSPMRARLEHRLKAAIPAAHIRPQEVIPARGAVRSAVRSLRATTMS